MRNEVVGKVTAKQTVVHYNWYGNGFVSLEYVPDILVKARGIRIFQDDKTANPGVMSLKAIQ
jgi:hypothetical protein